MPPRKSPDREEIEAVIGYTDVKGLNTVEERNEKRRQAVSDYLETPEFAQDAQGPQGTSVKDMILDDLESYVHWERS